MLKRHLSATYAMTPNQYRDKWNLPADYPMVAPAYAERRSGLARASGLGRRRPEPEAQPLLASKKRGRPRATTGPFAYMGTAFNPAKTSPASWDAFSDVDAFVDAVLAELAAMAADGTRRPAPGRSRR